MDNYNLKIKDLIGKGLSGIENCGNTCFLNSALQVLSNTPQLLIYFLDDKYKYDIDLRKKESKIVIQMQKIFIGMWTDNCVIQPISFRRTLIDFENKYQGYSQHDSLEVLSKLIDLLHIGLSYEVEINIIGEIQNDRDKLEIKANKSLIKTHKKEYSKILELFYGQYHSIFTCLECKHKKNIFESFNYLSLPITNECNNIYDCLNIFCKPEQLDDLKECNICKKKTHFMKEISIWKFPEIFIVGLNRFKITLHSSKKINAHISTPINNVDFTRYNNLYISHDAIYELYAIINHTGDTTGGHYYTYCKNINNKWYVFNDKWVAELDEINFDNSYVFVYMKKK